MSRLTYHQLIRWVTGKVAEKMQQNFYGTVTFHFAAGDIIHCKTEFTEKPTIDNTES